MAAQFHQASVYALFDAMPVPLLTFAVSGLVTYANSAAKNHPGRPVEAMSGQAVIKSLVADATLGKLKLPYSTEIELADGHRINGQFMPGPAGLDVAFLARHEAGAQLETNSSARQMQLKNIIELLRDEVSPPLNHLNGQLKALPPSPDNTVLEKAAEALSRRLQRLADVITVFGDEIMLTHDRIELLPVFAAVRRELSERAANMGVSIDLQTPEQTLPPIYGNEKLIRRALYECLDNALIHSRKEVTGGQALSVEIRFTLSGEHVLVGVRNRGATTLKVAGNDTLHPFTAPPKGSAAEPVTRLGLPLVQRIVGLHGGQMRLSTTEQDTVQVLMEFPTGAPQRGQAELSVAQAQRYAQDLAQLMSRRKKEKT
ncbi:MAG: hypothetical protein CK604_15265 [Curvibacter sp. PD_MW3]|nr:MAG: hypothetical protein CK604_15265 [Curvibacter sp. PD_MW3]